MIVKPTEHKVIHIKKICYILLLKHSVSIRESAQVIGTLVAISEGNIYGTIFYKRMEIQKKKYELKKAKGDYNKKIILSEEVRKDL